MKKKIIQALISYQFSEDFGKMVAAVSAYETGFWTSRIYRKNHNLFGMMHPVIRTSVSLGEKNNFASYQDNDNSIKDFVMYLRYFGYKAEYYGDLYKFVVEMASKCYFEADFEHYYAGVQGCYNELFSFGTQYKPSKSVVT